MTKFNCLLVVLLFSFKINAQITYLHCGKLIDGSSAAIQTEMTIVVEGNKITDIKKGYQNATGVTIIDLLIIEMSTCTVPGIAQHTTGGRYLDQVRSFF